MSDTRGNIAIIFSLSVLALLLAAGAALDFGQQVILKQNVQIALDDATMTALAVTNDALNSGSSSSDANAKGLAAAQLSFKANATKTNNAEAKFNIDETGATVTVNSTAHTVAKNGLMSLTGLANTDVNALSQASGDSQMYRDFYLLADVSTSMLLPSTPAGIKSMETATGCALACHDNSGGTNIDSYNFAKKNNIVLRYDVLNQGIGQLMDYLKGNTTLASHTRVGLWTFDSLVKNPVAMTSNFASVKTAYPAPALVLNDASSATPFASYIDSIVKLIGKGGDGGSRQNAKKILILATDGVNDPTRAWTTQVLLRDQVKAFDMSFCDTLKSNNVSVAVVYTPYYAMPYDWGYNATLGQPGNAGGATRVDDIPIVMAKCAGDLLVVANDAATLKNSFQTIFEKISVPRLTQ